MWSLDTFCQETHLNCFQHVCIRLFKHNLKPIMLNNRLFSAPRLHRRIFIDIKVIELKIDIWGNNWAHLKFLGMEYFHPTIFNGCNYLSILGLKLIHISKCGPLRNRHFKNKLGILLNMQCHINSNVWLNAITKRYFSCWNCCRVLWYRLKHNAVGGIYIIFDINNLVSVEA